MCIWNHTNDKLFFPKNCVYVCAMCSRDIYSWFKVRKGHVMVVFLRAQPCVNRDDHIKYNVADLNGKYYLNESMEMHLKMY